MTVLLVFVSGAALSVSAWVVLQRLDPPKKPGESRFEGVLPDRRGLGILASTLALLAGLAMALVVAPMMWYF